jgi:hypothetical protein
MKEAEKKFIDKFGEKKFVRFRRCFKLGLKIYEIEVLTRMSRKQIYYWKERIF